MNYRGSSGFGRAYRRRLNGEWASLTCSIVSPSLAGRRGALRSGTDRDSRQQRERDDGPARGRDLRCLSRGASLYGVMDLEAFAADTHKFEARYMDGLIGPLPDRARYAERSPINHLASIDVPVALFQGLDDHVVPPNQAIAMRDALTARGIPVRYEAFEGEGHGFRKAASIERALTGELAFYRDVFGLTA